MNIQRLISIQLLASMALAFAPAIVAQEGAEPGGPETLEEVVAIGIRGSLATALEAKRNSDNLVEAIFAEDVGKLPDQNLAEVLENITGVQINRAAGVGTGVQIRGTSSNRVEINGVTTMGNGDGRGGISFDDVSASIISSVEVTKSPTAKTIEGSVGGTINLRTARPLNLSERVGHLRFQMEDSDLSVDGDALPRISGTFGDNWTTDSGDFGIIVSASYAEQDVTAFRPRVDRDALVLPTDGHGSVEDYPFMRIQFLNQVYNNYEYETANISGTLEWAPSDNTKFWIDTTINDQQRGAQNYSAPLSGTTDAINVSNTVNETFETVDFGSLKGEGGAKQLPTLQAVTSGYMPYNPLTPTDDPNLRSSTNTNTRETTSEIFKLGGEWVSERLTATAEASISQSDSASPSLGVQLDFVNPHTAQPGDPGVGGVDNATPAIFDIRDGVLQFGLLEGTPFSPSTAELLDPYHWKLRQISQSRNIDENSETALRTDFVFDLDWNAITTLDFGYRYAERTNGSLNIGLTSRFNNARTTPNRPRGDLFSDILIPGPDNFNAADGRSLFIRDFLQVDPARSYNDPASVVSSLNSAITAANEANNDTMPLHGSIAPDDTTFFDADETTHALYAQANFESGMFRGNFGIRYLGTTFNAIANSDQNGVIVTESVTNDYDFVLPRINVVADVREDMLVRFGFGKDINRASFSSLSPSADYGGGSNDPVEAGNPSLVPEEVESFDLSWEWYFAPGSALSAGYFHKNRTNLFTDITEEAAANVIDGNVNRDVTPPCEDGGIFNPVAGWGVNHPGEGFGICVGFQSTFNGTGSTTQSGFELAFQTDLARFEDELGWASGFGFLANATFQEFDSGDDFLPVDGGSRNFWNNVDPFVPEDLSNLTIKNILLNHSEESYNLTLFYEKYGLSARARYTWRDAFRSTDDDFFGVDIVEEARGQLNASIRYAVNDSWDVGLEVINLTQADAEQSCVNEGALLCFQDLTDRRMLLGASYRF